MDAAAIDLRPPSRYLLPDHLREQLQAEFGVVVQSNGLAEAVGASELACVGDMVSITAKEVGLVPRVFVCDFHTQRGEPSGEYRAKLIDWGDHAVRVRNPPGEITATAWDACVQAVKRNSHSRIQVDGEEDLLALPLFLAMPRGSKVLYGVPDKGVAVVTVDADLQQRVAEIVGAMVAK